MDEESQPRVHLIPDEDECTPTIPAPQHQHIANSTYGAFYDSSLYMQRIGSSMIHHQAAVINRRLLAVQKRVHDESSDSEDDEPPRRKRRKDTATPDNDNATNAIDKEQLSIVNQVERMKRMSYYLKNASIAQERFLRDMQECVSEGIYL